ncbi:hypothetical protein AB0L17_38430 [Streptomyces cellulosae]
MSERRTVALVTLGCARNEVDSEELAGRLEADGWRLVEDAEDADVAVVNTCGFVEAAKKDSVDALLEANARAQSSPTGPVGRSGASYHRQAHRTLYPTAQPVMINTTSKVPSATRGATLD